MFQVQLSSQANLSVPNAALFQRAEKAEQQVVTLKRHLEVETQRKVENDRAAYCSARNFQIEVNLLVVFSNFYIKFRIA